MQALLCFVYFHKIGRECEDVMIVKLFSNHLLNVIKILHNLIDFLYQMRVIWDLCNQRTKYCLKYPTVVVFLALLFGAPIIL